MTKGPLGGPRPLADSQRRVIVTIGLAGKKFTDGMRRKLEHQLRKDLIQYSSYSNYSSFLDLRETDMGKSHGLKIPPRSNVVLEVTVMVGSNTVSHDAIKSIEETTRDILNRSAYVVTDTYTVIG